MYNYFVKLNNQHKNVYKLCNNRNKDKIYNCNFYCYTLSLYNNVFYLSNGLDDPIFIGNDITRLVDFFNFNNMCYIKNISLLKDNIKYLNSVFLDSDDCERIHDYINTYVSSIKFNNKDKDKKISVIVTRQKDIYSYISKALLMGYELLYKDDFRYYLIAKDNKLYVISEAELNLGCMFSTFLNNIYCDSIFIDNLNVSKITSLKGFFEESSFESVVWRNVDTSNVTDFSRFFYLCRNLSNIDITCFNTCNTTNFDRMFAGCESLQTINISNFNTISGYTFQSMFEGCYNLETINMLGCETNENIVKTYANMFNHCHRLKNIFWRNFYKENSNIMDYSMFESCPLPKYYYIKDKIK